MSMRVKGTTCHNLSGEVRTRLEGLAQERNQAAKVLSQDLTTWVETRDKNSSKMIFLKTPALISYVSIHLLSFICLAALPGDICNSLLVLLYPLHK